MSQRFLTIEQRLAQVDGRPSGFDYLRLFLALSVICFHSIVTSYGNDFQLSVYAGHWRCIWALILPMFFSLSGFLVAGSLERSKSMITFLGLRAIRIVPALAGEVILSALVLGPIVTNMSWSRYFSSYEFLQYFLNILGDIHYKLPGVFQNNPLPELVNGQLWTVPFELACYGILTLIAVLGVFKNRRLLLFLVIGLYCLQTAKMLYEHQLHTDDHFIVAALKGRVLEMTFVCGIFLYRFREKVPFRLTLFLASFVASLATAIFSTRWRPFRCVADRVYDNLPGAPEPTSPANLSQRRLFLWSFLVWFSGSANFGLREPYISGLVDEYFVRHSYYGVNFCQLMVGPRKARPRIKTLLEEI